MKKDAQRKNSRKAILIVRVRKEVYLFAGRADRVSASAARRIKAYEPRRGDGVMESDHAWVIDSKRHLIAALGNLKGPGPHPK